MTKIEVNKNVLYGLAGLIVLGLAVFFVAPSITGNSSSPELSGTKSELYDNIKKSMNTPVAKPGDKAPSFELEEVRGGTVKLEDFDGQPKVLFFFATWCGTCAEKAPILEGIQEKYADQGLQLIGIDIDALETNEDVKAFLEAHTSKGLGKWVIDEPGTPVTASYGIINTSAIALVNRDGVIEFVGYDGPSQLEQRIVSELELA